MNYQIHCRGLQVTQLLDIHVAICSCWWFNHNARGWGNLYHNIILGWCKASRGRAFAHSIHADSTGEGLNCPLLAYCLCSQRFIGVNMCACSSGNCSATLSLLLSPTMAFTAQSTLCAAKVQVIYFIKQLRTQAFFQGESLGSRLFNSKNLDV